MTLTFQFVSFLKISIDFHQFPYIRGDVPLLPEEEAKGGQVHLTTPRADDTCCLIHQVAAERISVARDGDDVATVLTEGGDVVALRDDEVVTREIVCLQTSLFVPQGTSWAGRRRRCGPRPRSRRHSRSRR